MFFTIRKWSLLMNTCKTIESFSLKHKIKHIHKRTGMAKKNRNKLTPKCNYDTQDFKGPILVSQDKRKGLQVFWQAENMKKFR